MSLELQVMNKTRASMKSYSQSTNVSFSLTTRSSSSSSIIVIESVVLHRRCCSVSSQWLRWSAAYYQVAHAKVKKAFLRFFGLGLGFVGSDLARWRWILVERGIGSRYGPVRSIYEEKTSPTHFYTSNEWCELLRHAGARSHHKFGLDRPPDRSKSCPHTLLASRTRSQTRETSGVPPRPAAERHRSCLFPTDQSIQGKG